MSGETFPVTIRVVESLGGSNMAQSGSPGPAGIIPYPAGWALDTPFAPRHGVPHNGGSYLCLVAHVATPETEPEVGADWQTVWMRLAAGSPALTPAQRAARGDITQILGILDQSGGFDAQTLADIAAKQAEGWPDTSIQVRIVGTSSAVPATVVVPGVAAVTTLTAPVVAGSDGNSGLMVVPPLLAAAALAPPVVSGDSAASGDGAINAPVFAARAAMLAPAVSAQRVGMVTLPGLSAKAKLSHPLVTADELAGGIADTFGRANGGLGVSWTTVAGLAEPTIESQLVVSVTAGGAYWNADAFAADQFSEASVFQDAGVVARVSGTNRYEANLYYDFDLEDYYVELTKVVAGVRTVIDLYPVSTASAVVRIEVSGASNNTTVVVKLDGLTIITSLGRNDGIGAGAAGIYVDGGGSIDNWSGGDL